MTFPIVTHIEFGDNLDVTDLGDSKIRVDAGAGGGAGGGGIQFGTSPQEGNWIEITTTGREAAGDGEAGRDSSVSITADGGDMYFWATGGYDGERAIYMTGEGGLYMEGSGDGGILLRTGSRGGGAGDLLLETHDESGLQARAMNYIKLVAITGVDWPGQIFIAASDHIEINAATDLTLDAQTIALTSNDGPISAYAINANLDLHANDGIYMHDDGSVGIDVLAAGGGMRLNTTGGMTNVKNASDGLVVYSTGHFPVGFITDLDAALLETGADRPGVILGASDGLVISQGGIDPGAAHGSLNLVFLYADTGNNLLRSPVLRATSSNPGIPGALYRDASGNVKVSL